VARIDAVDFAAEAVARARELARGIDKITYGVVDLNRDELPPDTYDVVVAHSVLHHVENLEHAYTQLERTMRPDATLIINEYVGPNRFQYGDGVDSAINTLLRALPVELRKPYDVRLRPTVEEMIANDPTEAVRAEELVAFTEARFEVLERKPLGGAILQHLLYDIAENFRFDVPRERSMLQMLCTIDAMLTDSGRIPCDFAIFAARKKGSRVTSVDRPLPPRTEAANDVEPDPLRRLSWLARLRGGRVDAYQRRLLRLALLSQQPRRANLFEENARLGFHKTNAWEWLLANAPTDPAIRSLLETAAILAPA
jgi:SAM-dependent methyltransferase